MPENFQNIFYTKLYKINKMDQEPSVPLLLPIPIRYDRSIHDKLGGWRVAGISSARLRSTPPPEVPFGIRIRGLLETMQKLWPNVYLASIRRVELASLTSQIGNSIGGRDCSGGAGPGCWTGGTTGEGPRLLSYINYYGSPLSTLSWPMTRNPEVLAITIIEVDDDGGVYADEEKYVNEVISLSTKPIAYTRKTVFCMPKCRRHQEGTRDPRRMDNEIAERFLFYFRRRRDECNVPNTISLLRFVGYNVNFTIPSDLQSKIIYKDILHASLD
ncbi:hypothetical protein OIDMADRAFT_35657 [Oidiodendron maius Zn]|uniref:Uncharacterized protein n=1 Tax=Oidiodendron maius (strain Zn) TaxID=913774 RepID=A0A0C3GQ71_OIDMZ|nr:hypothetical protein OIDMADRAFT_35657 [Oidiodendron maius Zn]